MRLRFVALIALVLPFCCHSLKADEIRDINISLTLMEDGSALIEERWDINVSKGTEWYLVRENLGDIVIDNFHVSENGAAFQYEGEWDVDRSIKAKAGKCGMVSKANGVELCWGIGSYGDHVFEVEYTMSCVVKSLQDYDMLHMQLVSPGLSSAPKHVRVTIKRDGGPLNSGNTRIWGFGYVGTSSFADDGSVVFESSETFRRKSSVISLMRFDKGMFHSQSAQNRAFSEVLDTAMKGADFDDDEEASARTSLLLAAIILIFIGITAGWYSASARKKVLGCKISEVGWSRDIPYDGNLQAGAYTLHRMRKSSADTENLAAALILRMVYKGALCVTPGKKKNKVEISFNENAREGMDEISGGLFDMMLEASGSDKILQDKEFSRWSENNASKLNNWCSKASGNGKTYLKENGCIDKNGYTPKGQQGARELYGLKLFLKDFVEIAEKDSIEAVTWQEYLVYGALFGIADKVARQLHDIRPELFEEIMLYDYDTMRTVILCSRLYNTSVVSARAGHATGGFGGRSSFGGGRGFSGGGFGGGSR